MDTQAINNGKNSKVKETLKNVAPIAGGVAAGVGAFVASDVIAGEKEDLEVVEPIDPATENEEVNAEENQNTEAQPSAHNTSAADNNTTNSTEHQPQADIPQDQQSQADIPQDQQSHTDIPQDQQSHTEQPQTAHGDVAEVQTDDIPTVDPDIVAQGVINDDIVMVDPDDNDAANLAITSVGSIETVDGQVLTAAEIAGENGDNLYMVDVDNDGRYDLVEDASGNVLGEVPTTITVDDSQSIADINNGQTGYLAGADSDNSNNDETDNPMEDVVALG